MGETIDKKKYKKRYKNIVKENTQSNLTMKYKFVDNTKDK